MPKRNSLKVEKVVRKIKEFGCCVNRQKDAGKSGPSCDAGMAPQEGEGATPILIPCSPSAHVGPIGLADSGWCSLDGRSRTSTGAVPGEE